MAYRLRSISYICEWVSVWVREGGGERERDGILLSTTSRQQYRKLENIYIFWQSFCFYSPCPSLEGIKDALCHKFMCTNKGGHRDAFLMNGVKHHEFQEAYWAGHQASSEARGEVCSLSYMYLSIWQWIWHSSRARTSPLPSSCCWPAVRGVAYATIGWKFPPLSYAACMYKCILY